MVFFKMATEEQLKEALKIAAEVLNRNEDNQRVNVNTIKVKVKKARAKTPMFPVDIHIQEGEITNAYTFGFDEIESIELYKDGVLFKTCIITIRELK